MTTNRDFDQMARAWLDLMPDEAPDRLIANVRLAVDATPQERRWGWRAFRRSYQMNRLTVIAATAIVVLALVGGALLLAGANKATSSASPAPSITPAALSAPPSTTNSADLPSTMIAGWYGTDRQVPGLAARAGVVLFLDRNELRLAQSNQQPTTLVRETASIMSGRLQLVSTAQETYAGAACPRGTPGTYDVTVSASGNSLTLQRFSDACSGRAAALGGTWRKKGCWSDGPCYGYLDAGTFGSQYFDPRVDPGAPWVPNYGAVTVTVPDGWALGDDWPGYMRLTTAAHYAAEKAGTDPFNTEELYVVGQPFAAVGGGDCGSSAKPSVGDRRTPADLVAFLQAQSWLVVSKPVTDSIDGHPTTVVDLSVASGAKAGCPGDAAPNGNYLVGYGQEPWNLEVDGQRKVRVMLIDLGGGDVVGVVMEGANAAALDAFVSEATPIVRSLHFE